MTTTTRKGQRLLLAGALALMGLVSPPLWAHVHLVDQSPSADEVVAPSPAQVELRFDAPIRLTQFEVHGPDGTIALSERSVGEMARQHRAVPAEALAPGEYRVIWRGLAEDGHAMSGDYRFSVRE